MLDIIQDIKILVQSGSPFVTATVAKTWGSGPRKVGSGMVITSDNAIFGSVSGGCVEGDVIKKAREVFQNGQNQLIHYGISDDEAWEVGLSCGGQIEVLVEKYDPEESEVWKELTELVLNNQGCVLVSALSKDTPPMVVKFNDQADTSLTNCALEAYQKRKSGIIEHEGSSYFLNVFPRKSQLIIVGAAHISSQLVELASMYEFETIVVDPRGLFTDQTNFRVQPDQSHKMWPAELLDKMELNSDVYAVLLTHDPKIDDQALHILLKSDVSYIGALGSRKTHEKRRSRLQENGFSEEDISKIFAPIGVDINAGNPKEIALSIVGQLIQTRNQYSK